MSSRDSHTNSWIYTAQYTCEPTNLSALLHLQQLKNIQCKLTNLHRPIILSFASLLLRNSQIYSLKYNRASVFVLTQIYAQKYTSPNS